MKLYHYLFEGTEGQTTRILETGKLLPTDKLPETQDKYNRDDKDPDEYMHDIYDRFYKEVLDGAEYDNYGIYLTPVDLFKFPCRPMYRFVIDYNDIKDHTLVLQLGGNVTRLKSEDQINNLMKDFRNVKNIEKIWNSSKLKFQRLPQIVDFNGSIKISLEMLEKRSNNFPLLPQIDTPKKLWQWMGKNIEYAYMTDKGHMSRNWDKMFPDYRLETPYQVVENEYGVCWDQSHMEQEWFTQRSIECRIVYFELDMGPGRPSHTFAIFKDKSDWYYFENSFSVMRTVEKIANFKNLVTHIIDKTIEFQIKDGNIDECVKENTFLCMMKDFPPFGADVVGYMNWCHGHPNIFGKLNKGII